MADLDNNTIVCPVCGHENSAGVSLCNGCRGRLDIRRASTGQQAIKRSERQRVTRRRRRIITWSGVALVIVGIGLGVGYNRLGTAGFLPPPASSISATASYRDWPMYQRDPTHTGFVADDGSTPIGSGLEARFAIDAPIFTSPAVVDGRAYLGTGDRRVLALDAASGELIWERDVSSPVHASPAVAGDLVFTGLNDGSVIALDRRDGQIVWKFDTDGPIFSPPAVDGGILYVGSGDQKLYALDALTGKKRWSYKTDGWVISSPAVWGDVVAVTSMDGYLYIIDRSTGKFRLDYRTLAALSGAVFDDELLLVADEWGILRAIDWTQKQLPFEKVARTVRLNLYIWGLVDTLPPPKGFVWAFHSGGHQFFTTPVAGLDKVYVASISGTVFAVNRSTGEKVWEFKTGGALSSPPAVANGSVFVGDALGRLHAIDALTGEGQWVFEAQGTISVAPAFADGVLYITSNEGVLYASN